MAKKVIDKFTALAGEHTDPRTRRYLAPKRIVWTQGNVTGAGSEFFRIGPLKMLGDGALGARTAYLSRQLRRCHGELLVRALAFYLKGSLAEKMLGQIFLGTFADLFHILFYGIPVQ